MSRAHLLDVIVTWAVCAGIMVKLLRDAWREERRERSTFPQ